MTTNYLVDTNNLTGYAQVIDDLQGGSVVRTYTYGTSRISQDQFINSAWTQSFYGTDGQGSVRYLADNVGTITDTYDFDAFGNTINKTGTTPNNYLYDGEQFDLDLGQYYLRARYVNQAIGRFQTMDSFEGDRNDPSSLHHFTAFSNDPLNRIDPNGNFDISGAIGSAITGVLSSFSRVTGWIGDLFAPPPPEVDKIFFNTFFNKTYKNEKGKKVLEMNGGLNVTLGAYTHDKNQKYLKYRWVQKIISSVPTKNGISAGTEFYDSVQSSLTPQYYYPLNEELSHQNILSFDTVFQDGPNVTTEQKGLHIKVDFNCFLVRVNPSDGSKYEPLVDAHYGYTFSDAGVTASPDLSITNVK